MKKYIRILMFVVISILSFSKELSIMEKQDIRHKEILADIKSNKYSLEDPFIMVNPYDIAPQTALVYFETEKDFKVSVTILDRDGKDNFTYEAKGYNKKHNLSIYALYGGKNKVKLTLEDKKSKKIEKILDIRTERTPQYIITLDIKNKNLNADKNELIFGIPTEVAPKSKLVAYDNEGNVRWFLTDRIGVSGMVRKLENGNFLIGNGDIIKIPYYYSGLYEIDMLGRIHKNINLNGRSHHDFVVLGNGNILSLTNQYESKTDEDIIIEHDSTGKILETYDLKKILKLKNYIAEEPYIKYHFKDAKEKAEHDWAHINALTYNKEKDEIVISPRHLNAVIGIGKTDKKVKWILADPINVWITDELKEYLVKAEDKNFKYTYGQHGVEYIGNDKYLIYDNGNYSDLYRRGINKSDESYSPNNNVTRVLEVEIKNGKVKKKFEYIEDGIYTPFIGNLQKLGKNHYFINFGGITQIDGKATDNILDVIFGDLKGHSYSKLIEVKDGKVIFEANSLNDQSKEPILYRSYKIKF